ncbi:hypothetical protein BGW36DRAFT_355510 [Talaromyces proteolyticus]|uniref:Uncharacterized protein n=1 Tax=Talaromyces proteolyticus TaxID=1131652 RepID=A0AAD4Q2X8_9EURO|nr:uncharacterized protein BGW36DRAFT_355510 [Talaromyces proteolyticus]KAH8704132.1 hypothetical protein BGW36DRAFT_355510 [Talaromyces proteolyticus]
MNLISLDLFILIRPDAAGPEFGHSGDDRSLLFDVIKAAMENLGGSFTKGQIEAASRVTTSFVMAIVETSPVNGEELKEAIVSIWPTFKLVTGILFLNSGILRSTPRIRKRMPS